MLVTGLPAAGKSTLAEHLARALREQGRPACVIDGDRVRRGLSADLGFSAADRRENLRRVGHVATLLADGGTIAIVALIAPHAEDRAAMRELHRAQQIPFIEVFLDTPLEVCEQRDPRRLYVRARAGELPGFTGVDAVYEAPERPEVHLRPDGAAGPEQAAQVALRALLAAVPG